MKLSKKLEAEVLEVYEAYWHGLLNADMETYAATLDKDFKLIGTTEAEIFFKRVEAVRFLEATADQVAGNIELRNRIIKIEPVDTLMLITEQSDAYARIDDVWTFYGKTRTSSLLLKKDNGWKLIQMHISFPDNRTEEGETIALEQIKMETLQLRDAVKRRTIELENKTRDLEIEASLERVRAVALGMKKPTDLPGICEVLFVELTTLGFAEIRNAMINIHDDDKATFINYDYSDEIGQSINHLRYDIHPVIEKQIRQMRSAGDAFSETYFKGKDLDLWKAFRKNIGEKDDPRIEKTKALYYYFYSIGTGSIGISTFNSIAGEKLKVLKRFRNVFDFAYRRYMDVAQAEAQAKEAQIELALERVRARAMAMQNSDELIYVADVMREQMGILGQQGLDTCAVHLYPDDSSTFDSWYAFRLESTGKIVSGKTSFPKDGCELIREMIDEYNSKLGDYILEAKGAKLKEWIEVLANAAPELTNNIGEISETGYYHLSDFSGGSLVMASFQPPSAESLVLQKKCANTFDLAYRRYLDLKKAEAQAREAQIETALERVRSRTMGMQKSEELPEAANLLFQQMQALGMPAWSAGYCIWDEGKQGITLWMSSEGVMQPPFHAPLTEDPSFINFLEAYKKGETLFVNEIGGEALVKHYQYMRTLPVVGEILDSIINEGHSLPGFQIFHCAYFSLGFLLFITYETVPEAHDIFKRFGKVFDQTYTRFLDLQKAEAQARESQIQLALERVRARTMAMQKSEELKQVAALLFKQVSDLGINIWTTGFKVWSDDNNFCTDYVTNPQGGFMEPYIIDSSQYLAFVNVSNAKKRGDDFFMRFEEGEQLEETYKQLSKCGETQFKAILDSGFQFPSKQYEHHVFGSKSSLLFITYEPVPEAHDIFKRFGKVFEQTYTRFLDLQKAEAQAREAQIEAALEKVRSRSLAMHTANELGEVVTVIVEKLRDLGVVLDANGVVLCTYFQHSKDVMHWIVSPDYSMAGSYLLPYFDHPIFNDAWQSRESGDEYFSKSFSIEAKNSFFEYAFEHSDYKYFPEDFKQWIFQNDKHILSFAWQKNSAILIPSHTGVLPTESDKAILIRFAKVFEQSYVRFLDLQKAEAQARESQIQLALERVSAKTMAMQKPSEFVDIINIIGEQFVHLGFDIDWVNFGANGFAISEGIDIWNFAVIPGASPISARVFIPYFDHPVFTTSAANINEFLNDGRDFIVVTLDKQTKDTWLDHLFTKTIFKDVPEEYRAIQYTKTGYTTSNISLKDTWLSIGKFDTKTFTDEQHAILRRFAKAFGQANTRFLDLQKAEAQAREAQIEAALEKVRSRSMGMQKSEELKEVIQVVYEQFGHLNIHVEHTGFVMDYKARDDYDIWIADQLAVPSHVTIPYFDCVYYNRFNEAKKRGEDFFATNLDFEEKNRFYQKIIEYVPGLPEETKEFLFSIPGLAGSTVLLENVCLYIENFEGIPYTDEENDTLMRFGKVFQQTYTRFLDLQKAEAQARESKIEAALERARTQSMLMQYSKELDDTLRVFHEQVLLLGINSAFSFLWLPDEDKDRHIFWAAWQENNSFKSKAIDYALDRNEPATAQCIIDWKSNEPVYSYAVPPAGVNNYFEVWKELIDGVEKLTPEHFIDGLHYVEAFMKYGCFGVMVATDLREDEKKILGRFAIEFERAYTRFLDLQKAEAQAREAKIEASLEKVRSRTLAMHKSEELADAAFVLFQQLNVLGIAHERINIGIVNEAEKQIDFWVTDQGGNHIHTRFSGSIDEPTTLFKLYAGWKSGQKSMVVDLSGSELNDWLRYLNEEIGIPFDTAFAHERRVQTASFFSKGMLVVTTPEPPGPEATPILEKFAGVFNLTYTRFNDLQIAEAQTHKANIEVALERVRARALAMQQPEELVEVADVMRHEMGLLGVEELETSSIYINKENAGEAECWYSLKDFSGQEKTKVSDHFNLVYKDTWVGRQMFDFYQTNKKEISIVMQGDNRKEWINYCSKQSPVFQGYYGETIPDRTYHLCKFSNGSIGAATPGDISAESWELLQRAASVFSLAYSRFKDLTQARFDLQQLKTEKQRAEEALTELQVTQKHLIQSEKMASLGELTAGIAHEIQNPLNFVNNFSEVSNELIDEMMEEVAKGNFAEVKAIADDVKQNLEKINHHGKRADGIVKGMLQHSQSRTGVKEPTNINALADEYFRLAYHGLRAKDKLFNATLQTDYDESIGNINITPQDIGRVILNLITNAFFAVNEKALSAVVTPTAVKYEPTVSISTKRINEKSDSYRIEITVKDNGNGIPPKVLDKIFQPFFTTKPTGQGTGLGLSLAYDIVKAHSGEIKVETKDGEGTEFIIQLPLNQTL